MYGRPASWRVVRFGAFEVDRDSGELRKRGVRIKLQEQPLKILMLLLDRPGEIITRDQLRQILWPEGTFVDFEHSLNAAVAKLRQALGDSAENPRFVETVPRRGYRFIAPVEMLPSNVFGQETPEDQGARFEGPVEPAIPRDAWRYIIAPGLMFVVGAGLVLLVLGPTHDYNPRLTRITSDSGLATDPAISPDGKLIAYASDRYDGKRLDIWVQQLAPGGRVARLTSNDADEHQPSFSPDGSRIVYRSEQDGGGIYVVPALGGEPVRIVEHGNDPHYSPDGTSIAYWAGRSVGSAIGAASVPRGLYIVRATGGEPVEVQSDLRETGQPVWSPDGNHLLVYGSRGDGTDLPLGSPGAEGDWWVIALQGGPAIPTGALPALKKQGFSVTYPSAIPRPAAWNDGSIIFSGTFHDSTNLWRIPISDRDWQVSPPAQRLTFGSGFEVDPSVAMNGHIAFAGISLSANIWKLPIDTNRTRVTGPIERVSHGVWSDASPSISTGGKRLVFDSNRQGGGKETIWIKDFQSGREVMLASHDISARHPEISHDGSRVAYSTDAGDYIIPSSGGAPEKVCGEECAFFWDWSFDESFLLLTSRPSATRQINLLDLRTRQLAPFLANDKYGLFQSRLSPDQRWVVFFAGTKNSIFISPVRNRTAGEEEYWIRISPPNIWSDKPRWSPDGNRLYLVSEQDGFRCLYAQPLDPSTKRPIGPLIDVHHFHSARLSMGNIGYGQLEIGVAVDKIVFNLGELTGNIWMLTK